MSHSKYRRDIDGLRGIAILAVLGFHAFPQWIKSGFIGVDIFFVISGFLISSIILEEITNHKFSIVNFYVRRINRIFPALIITLVGVFSLGWIILISDQYKELCKHIAGGAAFLSNLILWNESGYFDAIGELKPLLNLWSLGIEEQFYIIWPCLLIAAWKFRNRKGVIILASIIIIISFFFSVGLNGTAEGFYSPISRFWELMIGSLLATAIPHNLNFNKYRNIISSLGFLFLLIGFIYIDKLKIFICFWLLLPTIGVSLLIIAGPVAWLNKHIFSNKILVWIGLISYPLYLYHWPLLSLAKISNGDTSIRASFSIIALSFALAALTYIFIEKPIRFGRHRKFKAAILLLTMIIIGCIGYYSYITNWTEIRLPPEFRKEANTKPPRLEWILSVRGDICDIENIPFKKRNSLCYEDAKPSVFLWGDSHAASLYPGLKKLQEQLGFGIVQLTQFGCPPIFNLNNLTIKKDCNEINEDIFNSALDLKPDIIILNAGWKLIHYELTNEELASKLSFTIQKLKAQLPSTKIIIIGPVPRWETSPKQVAFLNWRKSRTLPIPIMQQATRLDDIDEILKSVCEKHGVEFISAIKTLCDDSGCIAKTTDKDIHFIAWDYGHFTKSGSEFFVNKIKTKLF